jgi:hypothetical protein
MTMRIRLAFLLLFAWAGGVDAAPGWTEFPVPEGTGPHDVAPAPDGRVWFTTQPVGAAADAPAPASATTTHPARQREMAPPRHKPLPRHVMDNSALSDATGACRPARHDKGDEAMRDAGNDDREDVGDDFRWLSYGELGQARGISTASAIRLAFRCKWRRQDGNDGTVRVAVPVDEAKPQREVVDRGGWCRAGHRPSCRSVGNRGYHAA